MFTFTMEADFMLSSCRELISSIRVSHMKYLLEDKTISQIKYRNILKSCIRELLCSGYHKKFLFTKTIEILRRNAKKERFNALKAAEAWSALSMYAKNLYNQPWRSEFHEIKLYSGFYKHQIENHLDGAETFLELMGYKQTDYRLILNESIDRERLCEVSLDSLTAMCECQILFRIYEEVSKWVSHCTYDDIINHREKFPGTMEHTIQGVCSLYRSPTNCCVDCYSNSFQEHPVKYELDGYGRNKGMEIQSRPFTNGYGAGFRNTACFCSSEICDQGSTINLIDFGNSVDYDSSKSYQNHNANHLILTKPIFEFSNDHNLSSEVRKETSVNIERENSQKSYNYFHKYSNRGPLKTTPEYQLPLKRSLNSPKNNGVSEAFDILRLTPDVEERYSSMRRDRDNFEHDVKCSDFCDLKDRMKIFDENCGSRSWSCAVCTYINVDSDICEMCSKSRIITEEIPLERGGKHCSRCTLVNKKEATKCEACDKDLETSSTYV